MPVIDTLEWPPSALAAIERLTAENDMLRQYLGRAIDIAIGSGGDFRWDVEDELRQMRSYQQQEDN